MKQLGDTQTSRTGESGRADSVLRSTFKRNYAEDVLVQARKGATAADVRSGVRDVVARIRATGAATHIRSPLAPGNSGQLSKDGRAAVVTFEIKGTAGDSHQTKIDKVDPLLAATAAAARAHPSLHIDQFGDASVRKAVAKSIGDDFAKATKLSLPITLVILVVAFGALAAAGVPMLLALTSVLATMGLIAIPSHIAPVDPAAAEVVLLMGMAVGVDYALFYLRREREERAAGKDADAALEAAAATSGRSVLVSGLTVMTAMAGMYFTGDKTFESFATGAIMVVAIAVIGSLTVLPAILSELGDKVMKGRVPVLGRRRESGVEPRFWSAILRPVLRRPKVAAAAAAAVLIALTIPAFGMNTGSTGINGLPQDLAVTKAMKRAATVFPGGPIPAKVVVQAPRVTSSDVQGAIRRLEHDALASGRFSNPTQADVSPDGKVAVVSLPIADGKWTDDASNAALATLRNEFVPQTVGKVDGVTANVTGLTAQSKDCNDQMHSRAPIVFAFVLGVAFLLLMVTFRSIVIALKAIALNMLSVGAAYGVLVLVFQHGWFESLLGFKATGTIEAWLPLFIFVVLFRALDGLSGLHRQPDPRGVRSRDEDRGRGRARHQVDGRRRNERRDRHGRRVQHLRVARVHDDEADGRWPGGRRLHRRDDRPGGAAAGHDEAPGRLELVPAQAPPVAAENAARAGRRDGPGTGVGRQTSRTQRARFGGPSWCLDTIRTAR
jgi:uncharacterized membrane protein YdfJ with MMPL/SSD domain